MRPLMNALLHFPARKILETPAAGLAFDHARFAADDGVQLHGWWIPARGPARGHALLCHVLAVWAG